MVMKRSLSVCAVLAIIVFGVQANAQQKPAAAVDRATAEKAAADAATKQAAEIAAAQAEAARWLMDGLTGSKATWNVLVTIKPRPA